MDLSRMERKVTMETALKATPMRQLIKSQGMNEEVMVTVLAGMILRLASYFNLGNNVTEEQAIDTAFIILDKYPYETVEDFTLVFKNAKSGMYGKLFNRLDGHIIFEWIDRHMEEKARVREERHRQTKEQGLKTESEILESNEELNRKMLKEWKKSLGMDPDKPAKIHDSEEENKFKAYKVNYLQTKKGTK